MSDMPNCIWAFVGGARTSFPSGKSYQIGGWSDQPDDKHVQYVRADSHAKLIEALEKIAERFEGALEATHATRYDRQLLKQARDLVTQVREGGE